MTDEQLDELERLGEDEVGCGPYRAIREESDVCPWVLVNGSGYWINLESYQYAATAMNALPELIEEVRRLRAERDLRTSLPKVHLSSDPQDVSRGEIAAVISLPPEAVIDLRTEAWIDLHACGEMAEDAFVDTLECLRERWPAVCGGRDGTFGHFIFPFVIKKPDAPAVAPEDEATEAALDAAGVLH